MGIQTERPIEVITPLAPDELLFLRMTGQEQLGRPFEYNLELSSRNGAISPDQLLGQNMTVRLDLPDEKVRYFNGVVTRFAQVFRSDEESRYQATLRPWLWLLTRSADCRIFPPDLTAVDIIKTVFRDHGFSHFDDKLDPKNYRKWDYCVQYRETAFNFVSRLMEQEGIYFYHRHEKDKHTLVLSDSYSSHATIPGYDNVPYFTPAQGDLRSRDHLYDWFISNQIQTGAYAITDFDFEKPGSNLLVRREVSQAYSHSNYEYFDYPGEYVKTSDGETYVGHRIEELQAQSELVRASGNARGLTCGCLFTLTDYPREDQLKEYLIVSANYQLENENYRSGGGSGATYALNFQAMDAQRPFRPARVTPKPIVQGPQTAIVVGKDGEEIWTDEYGRVKVKFHWDRHGKSNETASCWVRVAQVWAGKNWGAMHIPRMGQEVIVEFLEGDPDRPIVTGRVYNGSNMPPYGLPGSQTQSGIKSRSTKGGDGETFNEIRFEDSKGDEELYLHAEKDNTIIVENDQKVDVGNNRTEAIKVNDTLTVGGDKSETVDGSRTVHVKKSHTEDIDGAMQLTVGSNRSMTIKANLTEDVKTDMSLSVGGSRTMSVTKDLTETVTGKMVLSVKQNRETTVDGNFEMNVKKDMTIGVTGAKGEEVTKEYSMKAKSVSVTADEEITFKVGDASISMKSNGDVTIKSGKFTLDAGSKDVVIKGGKVSI
ncbi:MAG: type VI secretion system tip protein VgrG, partial [Candidatus Eisenbacteria bacterium]|nr:type VI secretion system tip protein VgrG [Candidatus Eisenbacteria bacterium]